MTRSTTPILAIVFFILTCLGVFAFWIFTGMSGVATAIVALALAEYLIRERGFWGTGVESALWLGGLFALISALPHLGRPESMLVFAAAAGLAGLRVRNPYFGALAVAIALSYLAVEHRTVLVPSALGVATIALAALSRRWKHRSTGTLWIAILLTAPVVAASWSAWRNPRVWALAYLAFAVIALAAGIRLRHHAPFFAALIVTFIAAIEADLPIAVEWQLIAGGALLVALSALVSRALRDNETGFVMKPARITRYDDLLETAGTVALQPDAAATQQDARGDGGKFGGAGATGEY